MQFSFTITWGSVSGWWLPLCLLAGLLYAWVLYRQPVNLGRLHRNVLFGLRALAVAVIAFLLLSPLVRTVSYKPEKPLVLVVQDNSSSITNSPKNKQDAAATAAALTKLKTQLGDAYEVHEFNFDSKLNDGISKNFNGRQTDMATALKQLNDRFVNRNIGALVLATDGLYNRGADPQYEARNIKTIFYTVALGDTTPRRDLLIGNIAYNKTAFLGNDFMIEVLAEAYQANGESIRLTIAEDGKQVHSQTLKITGNDLKKLLPIKLNAGKKGLRRFTVSIAPVSNEVSTQNNSETLYIDVLDARQKILLLYDAVHPDIAVMRNAIEANRNYEVKTVSLSELSSVKLADYSLLILHQLTADASPVLKSFISRSTVPVWYTVGAQTSLSAFSNSQQALRISTTGGDMQEVFALPVNGFSAFTLSDSTLQKINRMPPLLAPYGNYGAGGSTAVLFRQKIGNVNTSYPLLAFADDGGRRIAVLAGEGLWRWRLAEYSSFGSDNALNELLSQSVQYLTANAAKQQFRVYPAKTVFDEGEDVLLNAELYNDALELVNTPDVKLDMKDQQGRHYNFLFSRTAQSYSLNAGTLPAGEYTFTGSTKLGERNFTAKGQLTIKQLNLEARQTAANHKLLTGMANESGGKLIYPSQIGSLADFIRANENIKTIEYEDKHYSELVDVKWIFILIISILSVEWFLRKREGEV